MKKGFDFLGRCFHRMFLVRVEKHVVRVLIFFIAASSSQGQTLSQALNTTNLTWTTSGTLGASGWTAQSSTTHDGVLAAQSGQLTSGTQTSTLQTTTNGPGTLTFWWYSPSINKKLAVLVNNVEVAGILANTGWEAKTIYLGTGSQTVKWTYSLISGLDTQRGFVDEVAFSPGETAPIINVPPHNQSQVPGINATFSVTAVGTPPLAYQWQFNGTNLPGATNLSLTITNVQAENLGPYRVVVANAAGTNTSADARLEFGEATAWGDAYYGQTSVVLGATNLLAVAAGDFYGLALRADGRVLGWGINNYGQQNVPADLTNAIAISAGFDFALALRSDGTVLAWGTNLSGQTDVPANLTNVVAIAAGGGHGLALKSDGNVVGWGFNFWGQTNIPTGLSNVVAIAAGGNLSLALRADGTVFAWGVNTLTNVPAGLSNVVALATSGSHCIVQKNDGSFTGWGSFSGGLSAPPSNWTNIVHFEAGSFFNVGLRSDGTVATWGSNVSGQTNVPTGLTNVIAIGAGVGYSLAQVGSAPPVVNASVIEPVLSSNGFQCAIPTQSGYVYRLEYKDSLSDTDWEALPLVAGTGQTLVLADPAPGTTQKFYRVRRW